MPGLILITQMLYMRLRPTINSINRLAVLLTWGCGMVWQTPLWLFFETGAQIFSEKLSSEAPGQHAMLPFA